MNQAHNPSHCGSAKGTTAELVGLSAGAVYSERERIT